MNKRIVRILILFLPLVILSYSQLYGNYVLNLDDINNSSPDSSRAMYVDGFHNILGTDSLENKLLAYAQSHEIKTLLLYNLHLVHNEYNLTDPVSNTILADFISKAKTSYGISYMGATSENGDYFTNVIDAYNNTRISSDEKFDIYNLEFEFWIDQRVQPGGPYCDSYLIPNGLPCNNAGGFLFFISALQTMNNLANNSSHPITVEAYVGWPTASQIDSIGDNLDRLRLHAYVSSPTTSFDYADDRLIDYALAHPNVDVSIIFSAEPGFMQTWLESNSMDSAENIFITDWMNGSVSWPSNINLEGFTYFTYSHMSDISLNECPSNIELKHLTFAADTTIKASCIIELNNVVIESPHQLTLIAPDVLISIDCNINQGASVILIGEDGCENE